MCPLPCQMLGSTHWILYQQMEYYTFPAIPKNIYQIEISFINTQTDYHLEKIPIQYTHKHTEILHLNATIFTKSTMYDWKYYVNSYS